ncbi:triose-phosphate isomerase [bacterium]|nr:triose-phosphate isomerase [bacterium]
MRPIVAGNWKMNPPSLREAKEILKKVRDALVPIVGLEVWVFPPAPYLKSLHPLIRLTSIKLGVQNIHYEEKGAFTGEISLPMVHPWVELVLVGHSERRALGETDKEINKKIRLAFEYGMKVILCVGETLEDYEKKNFDRVLESLRQDLENLPLEKLKEDFVLAYEPVWAIGTGIPADPDYVEKNIFLLRQFISSLYNREVGENLPILYGGSVSAENCKEFAQKEGINGFLVGGASLNPREFVAICHQTKEIKAKTN